MGRNCICLLLTGAFMFFARMDAQESRFGFCDRVEPFKWADNTPKDCPFPKSKNFSEIIFTGRYANYTDADTWYPSWADDDCMYSPWTDGYLIRG